MPVDSLVVAALAAELKNILLGGRVDRVYQPAPDEIRLEVRLPRETRWLVATWRPESARVHLVEKALFVNPKAPPLFLSVLRKHLEGGRVIGVSQPGLERALYLDIEGLDSLGRRALRRVVFEMAGRQANVVLVDAQSGNVIDAARRVRGAMSRTREIWPGSPYLSPPRPATKLDPLRLVEDAEHFRAAWLLAPEDAELGRWLVEAFWGISPLMAREVACRAGLDEHYRLSGTGGVGGAGGVGGGAATATGGAEEARAVAEAVAAKVREALADILQSFRGGDIELGFFSPTLVTAEPGDGDSWADVSAIRLWRLPAVRQVSRASMSRALEEFFGERDAVARFERRRQGLLASMRASLDKARRKLARQEEEFSRASGAEQLKLFGELLTANLGRIKAGEKAVTVPNYYSESLDEVVIPLNPALSASANAQNYFKRYAKARRAEVIAGERVLSTREIVGFLESLQCAVTTAASADELDECDRRLARFAKSGRPTGDAVPAPASGSTAGALGGPSVPSSPRPAVKDESLPWRFRSSDGLMILVGRNSRQNDRLTMETARSGDVWLHVKDAPGSHVIIQAPEGRGLAGVPETTLLEAAGVAAYYSRARHSAKVPVDYAERRHVRKPPGSRPGYVIYDHHRTVFVTPTSESVAALQLQPKADRQQKSR